jgi:hypothetical protein
MQTKTIAMILLVAIATVGATVAAIGTGIAQAHVVHVCPQIPCTPSQNAQGNDNSHGNEQQGHN